MLCFLFYSKPQIYITFQQQDKLLGIMVISSLCNRINKKIPIKKLSCLKKTALVPLLVSSRYDVCYRANLLVVYNVEFFHYYIINRVTLQQKND